MRPKFYPVLEMCINNGIELGLNRAYKHDDNPTRHIIAEHVEREITNQLFEWFNFEEIEE